MCKCVCACKPIKCEQSTLHICFVGRNVRMRVAMCAHSYVLRKRALQIVQKSPIHAATEPCIYIHTKEPQKGGNVSSPPRRCIRAHTHTHMQHTHACVCMCVCACAWKSVYALNQLQFGYFILHILLSLSLLLCVYSDAAL